MIPHYSSCLLWFFPKWTDAVTLGRHVFFRSLTPSDSLVRHESEHVKQFQEHGVVSFLVIYVKDYVAGRLIGLSHKDSYRNIRFEVLARAAESSDN